MLRKPWPIVLVSFVFFLIPIFNITGTYFILRGNYNYWEYLIGLFSNPSNYWALIGMIVPSYVAGFAIYSVKKWSYPVFLSCMLFIASQMLVKFSIASVLLPMTINIFLVSYVLLPKVRAAYYDPRLRWWETKLRYLFVTKIEIGHHETWYLGKMTNISEGGVFALIPSVIAPETIVTLRFEIFEMEIEVKAKIVYRKSDNSSYGLQFIELSKEQKKLLAKIIARLAKEKYEVTRPVPVWTEDLRDWFFTLIKTGKGMVPEITEKK
jgi:hypothetical protein